MHSTGPFTETKRAKRIRFVVIGISIISVIFAFTVQNQLLVSITKDKKQEQMITSSVKPDGITEVAMIKNRDNQSFLVLYEVEEKSFKFNTKSYVKIQTPISSILYDRQDRLWMKQKDKWVRLNQSLEKVEFNESSPEEKGIDKRILKTTKKDNVYKAKLKYDHNLVWSNTFTSNPIQTVPLDKEQEVWLVLFQNGETKVITTT
ncbi:hypothetical protein [Pontibacillus yanchengensis]|uniref:Uncharacterized protein n=1 Tax=Pontibacillus yanchengensis Y32 TaxID=1385514 RepID=A0A0A2TDR1_9BACI|nr:hypothetical protein [Pontibacillus yanchengensis]KGP73684.1 hypothetical protein N782_03255 [Pontibacillus yanchengensis Y32]